MSETVVLRLLAVIVLVLAPTSAFAQLPADLREAMQARDQAAAAKDAATWDRLTREDFAVVLGDGVLRTKTERLAHLRSQKPTAWVPPQDERVTYLGNVAIQRFRSGEVWAILVWVRDEKGWRVVAAQDTVIPK